MLLIHCSIERGNFKLQYDKRMSAKHRIGAVKVGASLISLIIGNSRALVKSVLSEKNMKNSENGVTKTRVMWYHIDLRIDKIKHGLPCFSLQNRPSMEGVKGV